jgi:hypothetical protein
MGVRRSIGAMKTVGWVFAAIAATITIGCGEPRRVDYYEETIAVGGAVLVNEGRAVLFPEVRQRREVVTRGERVTDRPVQSRTVLVVCSVGATACSRIETDNPNMPSYDPNGEAQQRGLTIPSPPPSE